MMVEIESVASLRRHLASAGDLEGAVLQGLDLRPERGRLRHTSFAGSVLLGCMLDGDQLERALADGATVFPRLGERPYRCYRPTLYTAEELLEGYRPGVPGSLLADSLDGAIYRAFDATRRSSDPVSIVETLAQRLHDHAIDDALQDLLQDPERPRRVVAIMGGHGLQRDDPVFAAVARIGRGLARAGYFVTTGGGPGAMEAGNLGGWLAAEADAALDSALQRLAGSPHYTSPGYLDVAIDVLRTIGARGESLAIPTWFYGHEPTNVFASHIAKYFANSLREEGLLAIATYGVVYAPGSAGTLQEVFMDAAQNHYQTFACSSPMVFLGEEHWTRKVPALPLLRGLAGQRPWSDLLSVSDDPEEIVRFIVDHPPVYPAGDVQEH
jgi:predicted Rossmann-fold nucleotide-binding protein